MCGESWITNLCQTPKSQDRFRKSLRFLTVTAPISSRRTIGFLFPFFVHLLRSLIPIERNAYHWTLVTRRLSVTASSDSFSPSAYLCGRLGASHWKPWVLAKSC